MTAVEQPAGEITLVFSDIEGSTRLLEQLGTDAYRKALTEHRRIVREAYGRYSGYEVDYEGDAFFYTFASATDAVAAVSAAMAGLEPGPIAIRVGVHTGTPGLDPPKYVGMDVHFAARVMGSAHGGQVVLSKATADLVEIELAELGEHRLKDIAEAVPLYQLGEGAFPPLKTISNTNLPRPASSFLGREAELQEVVSRIEDGARLLTLTGPGGTGKTRLALEAATSLVPSYKAGVFWVGLASLRDPALVTETIAQILGAKDSLAAHIAEREMLLLLDNLEQLIEAAPALSGLLQACPNLTLLVTSRELLRVQGEVEYAVPPLAEPEAMELFCERSQLEPSEEISGLCARLDSLPLAVELAAARTKALSVAQILERLAQRLDLLKGGRDADPRQLTLRATIEWSYELLSAAEQELFARLSVFAGGCTLEAAEEVCDADLNSLHSLVNKSFLRFTDERFWMLETIREYAVERLSETPNADLTHERLQRVLLDLLESFPAARGLGSGQVDVFERLEAEHSNVRLVVETALNTGDHELVLTLASGEWLFLVSRGHAGEADDWFRQALPLAQSASPSTRSRGTYGASEVARFLGDLDRGEALKLQVVDFARRGESEARVWLVAALSDLSDIALERGDVERAEALAQQALQGSAHPGERTRAMSSLASALLAGGDLGGAKSLLTQLAAEWKGRHDYNHAYSSMLLGEIAEREGQGAEARERFRTALRGFADLRDVRATIDCLVHLARLDVAEGRLVRAGRLVGAAGSLRERLAQTADTIEVDVELSADDLERGASMSFDEAVEYALASID